MRFLLRTVMGRAPAYEPGSATRYSNYGFTIAAAMAEARTGVAWEELVRMLVFEPLGMSSAGFGAPGQRESLNGRRHCPWSLHS